MARETRSQFLQRMRDKEIRRMDNERRRFEQQHRLEVYGSDIDERIQKLVDNEKACEDQRQANESREASKREVQQSSSSNYYTPSHLTGHSGHRASYDRDTSFYSRASLGRLTQADYDS